MFGGIPKFVLYAIIICSVLLVGIYLLGGINAQRLPVDEAPATGYHRSGWFMMGYPMFSPLHMFAGGVAILLFVLVGFWLLWSFIWHRQFPTDFPQRPSGYPSSGGINEKEFKKKQIQRKLEKLEEALIEGRISEDTYKELKEKYEKQLEEV